MTEKEEILWGLEQAKKAVNEYFSQSTAENIIASLEKCKVSMNIINEFVEDETFTCQSCGSSITHCECLQKYIIGSDGQVCSYPVCPFCEGRV